MSNDTQTTLGKIRLSLCFFLSTGSPDYLSEARKAKQLFYSEAVEPPPEYIDAYGDTDTEEVIPLKFTIDQFLVNKRSILKYRGHWF